MVQITLLCCNPIIHDYTNWNILIIISTSIYPTWDHIVSHHDSQYLSNTLTPSSMLDKLNVLLSWGMVHCNHLSSYEHCLLKGITQCSMTLLELYTKRVISIAKCYLPIIIGLWIHTMVAFWVLICQPKDDCLGKFTHKSLGLESYFSAVTFGNTSIKFSFNVKLTDLLYSKHQKCPKKEICLKGGGRSTFGVCNFRLLQLDFLFFIGGRLGFGPSFEKKKKHNFP